MIRLQNLHASFNQGSILETRALNGIDLSIKKGEFITIIGSNGAGKSTLLNILCGDILPTQGRIIIDNLDVTYKTNWQRSGSIARVFQDPLIGSCANLTIEENMAIAYCRGRSHKLRFALSHKRRDLFKTHLARLGLGLENRLQDPIGLLSGGQRQAVSLVMAILRPMKILILDEHTAALDPLTAASILKLTKEIIAEKNLTALMVTHSMDQALETGHRTVMLHEGKIIFDTKDSDRNQLTVQNLLDLFKNASGLKLDDDRLLLT